MNNVASGDELFTEIVRSQVQHDHVSAPHYEFKCSGTAAGVQFTPAEGFGNMDGCSSSIADSTRPSGTF